MKVKAKQEPVNTKLRIGDKVIVTAGKSRGQIGNIKKIFRIKNTVVIDDVNIGYKAVRPNPNLNEEGGIKPIERPMQLSNVAIVNPEGKADKLGYKFDKDGNKQRVYKSSGQVVEETTKK